MLHMAILDSTWVVFGCNGLYWTVVGYTVLYWTDGADLDEMGNMVDG